MKILLVHNGKGWGGGQEHLKDLAAELTGSAVEVHFTARAGTPSETRFKAAGYKVHTIPFDGVGYLKGMMGLSRIMREERFDIISVNRHHDFLPTVIARHFAFPLIKKGKLMNSFHIAPDRKLFLAGSADATVCISEHVRQCFLKYNPELESKTSILYYGINIGDAPIQEKFIAERKRRFFDGIGFPFIGMVGEFWKNQEELIDIIPLIKVRFPSLKVAFVGNGPDPVKYDMLMSKIRSYGIEEDVIFTGAVPREKIPDIFYDFDLSVTTHRNEGFGIVHLESLAAGTPVVAYNEGGFVDIFKGEEVGTLVDGGPKDFAAAVIDLLQDDHRRFAMGAEGYRLVKRRYSIHAMGQTYCNFYRKMLGGIE